VSGSDPARGGLRALFDRLAQLVTGCAREGEFVAAEFEAEASEFARFNHARLRQAGRVERATVRLRLVDGARQAFATFTLPGLDAGIDAVSAVLDAALDTARVALQDSAPDPLLDVNRAALSSLDHVDGTAFERDAFVDAVGAAAGDADLVGFAAAGPLARGWCSSAGACLWYQRSSVVFDYSIHLPPDAAADGARKAVKASWTGAALDAAGLQRSILESRTQAQLMTRAVRTLAPGTHRALLAPRALADMIEMLSWGGFSARAHLSGQSPLARLQRGEAAFASQVGLAEDLGAGFAPSFQSDGYRRPARVPLVEAGRFAGWLVSPRTAREFSIEGNAAADGEAPESLRVAPGTLPDDQALQRLGTGLWIGNFWYLNFAERQACRLTGMTRFATFWVERGEVVGPVEAMRFDDSLYGVLGEGLESLTARVERFPSTDTYASRSTGGIESPGALLGGLRFAL